MRNIPLLGYPDSGKNTFLSAWAYFISKKIKGKSYGKISTSDDLIMFDFNEQQQEIQKISQSNDTSGFKPATFEHTINLHFDHNPIKGTRLKNPIRIRTGLYSIPQNEVFQHNSESIILLVDLDRGSVIHNPDSLWLFKTLYSPRSKLVSLYKTQMLSNTTKLQEIEIRSKAGFYLYVVFSKKSQYREAFPDKALIESVFEEVYYSFGHRLSKIPPVYDYYYLDAMDIFDKQSEYHQESIYEMDRLTFDIINNLTEY